MNTERKLQVKIHVERGQQSYPLSNDMVSNLQLLASLAPMDTSMMAGSSSRTLEAKVNRVTECRTSLEHLSGKEVRDSDHHSFSTALNLSKLLEGGLYS